MLLLLFSYDGNWQGYFMFIVLELIVMKNKRDNDGRNILSRCHSLLRHSRAMFMRDVALP